MRLAAACITLAVPTLLGSPGLAAPAGSADYRMAIETFLAGQADPLKYSASYAEAVTRGLDGTWVALLSFPTGAGFADVLAGVCKTLPATISTTPEHGFVFTRTNAKTSSKFDVVFTSMGGNLFGQYTDPAQIFDYLGMKEGVGDPSVRINVLRANNGTATVNRLGDSILVIQTAYNLPAIYGRCE